MLKKISKNYFDAFQNKDTNRVKNILSPNVYLRDWDNEALGLESVILIYEAIFNSSKSIKVEVINLYEQGSVIIAELNITIDELPMIRIVDILQYSNERKIESLRAYKG